MKTAAEVRNDPNLFFHHSATAGGYVSRMKKEGIVQEYEGQFGKGCAIRNPRWDTTRYVRIEYYIYK